MKSKVYGNIKNAVCTIAYVLVFLVILDTVIIISSIVDFHSCLIQFERQLLWDGISESTKFDSFRWKKFCRICDWNSQKFDLGSTFDLEVPFYMCRIKGTGQKLEGSGGGGGRCRKGVGQQILCNDKRHFKSVIR